MSSRYRVLALVGSVLFAGLSAGCAGDDGVSPPATFAVGGSVSGLQTGTLVLRVFGRACREQVGQR